MFTKRDAEFQRLGWVSVLHSGTSPSHLVEITSTHPKGIHILESRSVLQLIEGGSSRQDRIIRGLDIMTSLLMFFMLTIGGCMIFMMGSCPAYLLPVEIIIGIVLIVLVSINVWLKFSAYTTRSTEPGCYSLLSDNSPLRTEEASLNAALLS